MADVNKREITDEIFAEVERLEQDKSAVNEIEGVDDLLRDLNIDDYELIDSLMAEIGVDAGIVTSLDTIDSGIEEPEINFNDWSDTPQDYSDISAEEIEQQQNFNFQKTFAEHVRETQKFHLLIRLQFLQQQQVNLKLQEELNSFKMTNLQLQEQLNRFKLVISKLQENKATIELNRQQLQVCPAVGNLSIQYLIFVFSRVNQ